MNFWNWLIKPMVDQGPSYAELLGKTQDLEREILRLEKELIHWKRIALEFKRHH